MPPSRSRPRLARPSRRPSSASSGASARPAAAPARAALRLTHFGAAGWSIADGATKVLLDPYFSRVRFKGRPYGAADAATVPGDVRPTVSYDEAPTGDIVAIERHVTRADYILLSHSHFNHAM